MLMRGSDFYPSLEEDGPVVFVLGWIAISIAVIGYHSLYRPYQFIKRY